MPTKAADYLDEKTLDGLNKDEPSNRELAEGIKLILRKLWSEEDINSLIDKRHKALCDECPLRKAQNALPVPQETPEPDAELAGGKPTGAHVALALIVWLVEVAKAPWFWIVAATICALACAKYGISLPVVGGGN